MDMTEYFHCDKTIEKMFNDFNKYTVNTIR